MHSPDSEVPKSIRKRAEERLSRQTEYSSLPLSAAESQRVIHELEVHRIELEIQNEELCAARAETEQLLEQFTDLYDFAPVSYVTLRADGTISQANLTSVKLFHLERVDLVNKNFHGFVADSDRQVFSEFLHQVLSSCDQKFCEIKLVVADQPPIEVLIDAMSVGEGQECRAAVIDISERKQLEATIKKANLEWRLALDASENVIFLLDNNQQVLRANSSFFKLMRITPKQAIGRSIADIIHPEGEITSCSVCLALKKKQNFSMVMEVENADNVSGKPVVLSGTIVYDENGAVAGTQVTVHDLTESRKTEQKIRDSELKFRLLADYTYDWESWVNPQGEYVYISLSCERITGFHRDEFTANPELFFDLVRPADRERVKHHFLAHNNSEVPVHLMEFALHDKNGELHWIEHRCVPVFDEQGRYAGRRSNNRDITERKRAEAERQELEFQLRQKYKMEALGVMAGGMAHNFNNNLAIILGNLELSRMRLKDSPEIGKFLDNAKIAVLRSRDLVKQIMTYSRKNKQQHAPLNLSLLLNETTSLLQSTIPSSINLQQRVSPECSHTYIMADASQIQECLLNLCNNAVQAMDDKGELVLTLERVYLKKNDIPARYNCQPGDYLCLSVQDSGCGIPAEALEKIFDPFFTTKDLHQGTGMGLPTVQGIIEQHEGLISVESCEGQGAVFQLCFPMVDPIHQNGGAHKERALQKGTGNVLLIDDDEMIAGLNQQLLSEMGYQVTVMTDSVEALKLFTANADNFALVITDQVMPDLTGTELIKEIKQLRPEIPTILCTGFSSKVNKEVARRAGISAFLLKPTDFSELSRVIREVLEQQPDK